MSYNDNSKWTIRMKAELTPLVADYIRTEMTVACATGMQIAAPECGKPGRGFKAQERARKALKRATNEHQTAIEAASNWIDAGPEKQRDDRLSLWRSELAKGRAVFGLTNEEVEYEQVQQV